MILRIMKIFATETKLTPSWNLFSVSVKLLRENLTLVTALAILASTATLLDVHIKDLRLIADTPAQALENALVIIGSIWLLVFTPAYIYAQLQIVRGKKVSIESAVRAGFTHFWRVIGSMILVGIIIFGGLLLFIIPGLLFIRRYSLTPFYVIDNKDITIREALRRSSAATKPVSGYIWGVIGVTVVLSVAVGVFMSLPLIGIILAGFAGYLYDFALPLRYAELEHPKDVKKLFKSENSKAA